MINKKELRKEILQLRDGLTVEERQLKSHQITEQISQMKEFLEANKVLLFASYKSEVNTTKIFETARSLKKDIYYPKVIGEEMEFYQVKMEADLLEGYRGIREPEEKPERKFAPEPKDKIFVLMPGAVFDQEGNRIGYGGGYYDKFLAQLESNFADEAGFHQQICKVAIAFSCQMVDAGQITSQEHDIRPRYLVTEEQILKFSET